MARKLKKLKILNFWTDSNLAEREMNLKSLVKRRSLSLKEVNRHRMVRKMNEHLFEQHSFSFSYSTSDSSLSSSSPLGRILSCRVFLF